MAINDGLYDSRAQPRLHNSQGQDDLNDGKYSDGSSQYGDMQNGMNEEDDDE